MTATLEPTTLEPTTLEPAAPAPAAPPTTLPTTPLTAPVFTERYLLDPAVNADPYPYLNALRDHAPVHWSPLHRAWLVTGHAQLVGALREPAASADRVGPLRDAVPEGARDSAERAFGTLSRWMVFTDAPDHRRLRQVFQEQFSARAINRYRPLIERVTRALLTRRAVPGRVGDLIADVAKPLPALVFARWLGVPQQHHASFWYWNAKVGELVLGGAQEEREYRTSLQSLVNLEEYLADLVGKRRADPQDDLISAVLAGGQVGDKVTEDEFVGMLTQMAFAGGETTSNLIANAARALLLDPEQLAAVRADPGLVGAAVEEAMRFDGPSKMSIRLASRDFELSGARVRAGDRLFLVTAAANRDPSRYPDPDRFQVTRADTAHLGFGFGAHFCIGAALARLVARSVLGFLVTEYPGLRLEGDRHTWQPSLLNRSLTALPVRY
ncbi:cytochrome P450 [Actinosynnema mirum]|uniref:Cytochrome P450 n=1 Tax=Actinosynnema mirum (strain ATCC 29888 / DSM 43827 / JCM 3225 / NBRC 14064 / NCIMB 13271 / NRRL B-12336 / IMRU 3971 / 101) TaxID=446462 RepID=C6WAZ7_ACTMD|nr:cytochrome P450 [Actinosynnema mirum]ACU37466.1 cytochrome P450 [Actinosynnema mirum DSM 43827]